MPNAENRFVIPCLSQVCSLASPLETTLADYSAGKCTAVELWLTSVEDYIREKSVGALRDTLHSQRMTVPAAAFQGGLLSSQGERRAEAWRLLLSRLDLCRDLSIPTIIVAGDVSPPLTQETIGRVQLSLRQAAEEGAQRGVRIALEFQANAVFGNNLQTAVALIEEVNSPWLGICLDAYHWFTGPSKSEDLNYLTAANLFHVQFCDLADVPRELASDSQRIVAGDGDIPLSLIVAHLRQIGYQHAVSLELLNPQIWPIPPLQFGEIGLTALRKVLGLAQDGNEALRG